MTTFETQRAPAIIGRILISLGALTLGAAAFRLSLLPQTLTPPPGSRTFTQRDARMGAQNARIRLDTDRLDLTLDTAELPGLVLQGQLVLPGTVTRNASRAGNSLTLEYTERLFDTSLLGSRTRPWTLRLARDLPAWLALQSTSGDLRLNLAGAQLKGLTASTTAGDLNAELPAGLSGDTALSTVGGDLRVHFAGQAAAGEGRFKASSLAGDQRLDLSGHAFGQVSASSAAGDLSLTLASGQRGGVVLKTLSGDVTLRLPPGLPAEVTVKTLAGDLHTPDGVTANGGQYRTPAARAGQPAVQVAVNSVGGDVTIVQLKAGEARP